MILQLNSIEDFTRLYKIIFDNRTSSTEITIDLKLHDLISPRELLMLAQFIIFQKNKNCKINISLPTNVEASNYIKNIGLIDFCNERYFQSESLIPIADKTAIPLWKLEQKYLVNYNLFLKKIFSEQIPGVDLSMFSVNIAELVNNVYDHSKTKFGAYVFAQYFPNRKIICVVVGDLGIGIPMSVNNHLINEGKNKLSNIGCIKWALQDRNTAASFPHNQGRGLNNLYSYIQTINGDLNIYSAGTHYSYENKNEKYMFNPIGYFKGTLVEIVVDIDSIATLADDDYNNDLWN